MENQIDTKAFAFAVRTVNLYKHLKSTSNEFDLFRQVLRSGTSIGANIHEGNYAASRADFINKFQIALKECYETEYWLEIMKESDIITAEKYDVLISKCGKIRKILISSINTAKDNAESI